ncbi:MAG: hypothetical protein ACHRHE_24535 [Tepidisphaerales bacterium]
MLLRKWAVRWLASSMSLTPETAGPNALQLVPPGLVFLFGFMGFAAFAFLIIPIGGAAVEEMDTHAGAVMGLFAAVFVVALICGACWATWGLRRANRRLANGLCVSCGYDLRASESRCPECGIPIPSLEARQVVPSVDAAAVRRRAIVHRGITRLAAGFLWLPCTAFAIYLQFPHRPLSRGGIETPAVVFWLVTLASLICLLTAAGPLAPKHPDKCKPPPQKAEENSLN